MSVSLSYTALSPFCRKVRMAMEHKRLAFTLGINLVGGGVRQDLYTWDLVNGRAPTALTANGASFGAEWLGSAQFWQP